MQRRIFFFLYRIALTACIPILILYLVWRIARNRRYAEGLGERFGGLPPKFSRTPPGAIWLHAVSVGEVISAVSLIESLRASLHPPAIFVSVSTLAGRELAEKRLAALTDGIFYVPFDFAWCVRRVLRRLRPALLIVMETEIWPNLWNETTRSGARLLVVNARISDRAFARYRIAGQTLAPVLALPDRILAQSAEIASRYRSLGAPPDHVEVAGNLKYDFVPPAAVATGLRAFLDQLAPHPIWVAASTMPPREAGDPDEDTAVLDAFESVRGAHPRLLLILAPRRPERFDTAAAECARRGLPTARRSRLSGSPADPAVLLLDTIGELAAVFALADVVFMGGTLARRGGHNILEPAFFGRPIVSGPNLQNFAEIAAAFRAAGALEEIATAADLGPAIARLLDDPVRRETLGQAGLGVARSNSGATRRATDAAAALYNLGLPVPPVALWKRLLLTPLSVLWRCGVALDRRRRTATVPPLPVPVLSIGGISMGGSGKTPLAIAVARELRDLGHAPGFLTRGYGRTSTGIEVAAPGATLPMAATGDEASLLIASGTGPTAIGADRSEAAKRLLAAHPATTVLILDDGFQHWPLPRRLDIVAMDALDPFAGPGTFPLGRRREPLQSLARASAFVITRTQPERTYPVIEARIRRYNRTAPIFQSPLEPLAWIDCATGARLPLSAPAGPAAAFCGLGNPDSFSATLRSLGVPFVEFLRFPDHHRYSAADLDALDAPVLLTTEKDRANLPPGYAARRRIYALEVALRLPPAFRAWLQSELK